MINDFHAHFIPESIGKHTSFFKGVWSDKQAFTRFLDENNIAKAHIVYPSTDAYLKIGWQDLAEKYNREILAFMEEGQGRIIGSALVPLEGEIAEGFLSGLKSKGFRSISLPSSHEGKFIVDKFRDVLGFAEKYRLSVFIHPQIINPIGFERVKDPLLMPVFEYSFDVSMCLGLFMMEGVFRDFTNLRVVFSSLSGVAPFLKDRFDGVYQMLKSRGMVKDLGDTPSSIMKQAYVDLSGIKSESMVRTAVEFFGGEHIIFGSDYPANRDISAQLKALDFLNSEATERIMIENFLGVLGL